MLVKIEPHDPPPCASCQFPLDKLLIRLMLKTVYPPREIDRQTVSWDRNHTSYPIFPGFLKWLEEQEEYGQDEEFNEPFGFLETYCEHCNGQVVNMISLYSPPSIWFKEDFDALTRNDGHSPQPETMSVLSGSASARSQRDPA